MTEFLLHDNCVRPACINILCDDRGYLHMLSGPKH